MPLVVLHHTQDLVNIASVVRIMKNFELDTLRLVSPAEFDVYRIEGIAHKTGDILRRARVFHSLDEALADCRHVVGFTARGRTAKGNFERPRELAERLAAGPALAPVALLFGPEDKGLTNAELDRCHRVVTIPTSARYASLNLAQAVAIVAYELMVARGVPSLKPPRRRAPPAPQEQLELLFADAERALGAIDFFKTRQVAAVMRTVRSVLHRTPLDLREVKLARAICIEVVRFLERTGRAAGA
ncbi:MAG TPA: TrmJ/YjtD family RNA methyltransferase [Gemmatimonadales bacterium]|nr:TrmJ/YjtD family RNA methyltransferase [Gemmatimonadales bacterium]